MDSLVALSAIPLLPRACLGPIEDVLQEPAYQHSDIMTSNGHTEVLGNSVTAVASTRDTRLCRCKQQIVGSSAKLEGNSVRLLISVSVLEDAVVWCGHQEHSKMLSAGSPPAPQASWFTSAYWLLYLLATDFAGFMAAGFMAPEPKASDPLVGTSPSTLLLSFTCCQPMTFINNHKPTRGMKPEPIPHSRSSGLS